jgi:hypothetical protein
VFGAFFVEQNFRPEQYLRNPNAVPEMNTGNPRFVIEATVCEQKFL